MHVIQEKLIKKKKKKKKLSAWLSENKIWANQDFFLT